METYIGTKVIKAEPMDEGTFLTTVKGKKEEDLTNRETKEGYLVVYPNPEGDYKSWSPKDVFEAAYRKLSDREKEFINK